MMRRLAAADLMRATEVHDMRGRVADDAGALALHDAVEAAYAAAKIALREATYHIVLKASESLVSRPLVSRLLSLKARMPALGVDVPALQSIHEHATAADFLAVVQAIEGRSFRERLVRSRWSVTQGDLAAAREQIDEAAAVQTHTTHPHMVLNNRMSLAMLQRDHATALHLWKGAPPSAASHPGALLNRAIATAMVDDQRAFFQACAELQERVGGTLPESWHAIAIEAADSDITTRLKLDRLTVERCLGLPRNLSCDTWSALPQQRRSRHPSL